MHSAPVTSQEGQETAKGGDPASQVIITKKGGIVAKFSYSRARDRKRSSHKYQTLRLYVLARDENICTYCGADAFQVDHVVPYVNLGPHNKGNMVASCSDCNHKKNDSLDEKWTLVAFRHLISKGEDLSWMDQ